MFGALVKKRPDVSVFKVVAPQDGGWSLMPMENLLRGLRNHEEMVSLELFGVEGVVSYCVRSANADAVGGMLHSYFNRALIEQRKQDEDPEIARKDWLALDDGEFALVQPLSLAKESYLPLRVFDDRTIEQSKTDPLAGVIGLLASCTTPVGDRSGDRLGFRLVLRPAEENWNAPWQAQMQRRRDGEDRNARPGSGPAQYGPSTASVLLVGSLAAVAGGNYLLWNDGNLPGMMAFNLLSFLGLGAGLGMWRKWGGRKQRFYMDEELVEAKLKSLAFWAEVQIVRIYQRVGDLDMAKASTVQVLDCLRSFDDPAGNAWEAGKVRLYRGSDVVEPGYRKHPFVGGGEVLSWLEPKRAGTTALSAREVASVWHPPLGMDEMASMERTASAVLMPYLADLGVDNGDAGPLVGFAGQQPIQLPESALRKHGLVLGRSGTGKSTFVKHVIAHKLERKAAGKDSDAIVVIDPHADLVRDILKMVPPSIAHKVRLLDFGRMDRVPGINLVDPKLFPDRDRCVDTIINTVKHLWEHWGGRLEDLLKRSLLMVYEFNSDPSTQPDEMLTMLDILALLEEGIPLGQGRGSGSTMSTFQRRVISRVRDPRLIQWFNAYLGWDRQLRSEAVGPVHSRIGAYASDQRASVIMGQRQSTIMLSDVLSEGLVLLVSTAQGSIGIGPAALMGGTMVSLVESALRDQESLPPSQRAKCALVCDEFQTVTGANWEGMLAESRKYGCSLLLATQSLARLDTPERKLKAGILGNVGCIVGYQMAAEDARIIAPEMDSERVQERDLSNLNPHHCVVRINSEDKCYPAFSMKTLPPPDDVRGSQESVEAVLEASRAYTMDWAEAREKMNQEVAANLSASEAQGRSGGDGQRGTAPVGENGKGSGPSSPFLQALEEGAQKREKDGPLKGLKTASIQDSQLPPDLLVAVKAALDNGDPAVREIVNKHAGRVINRAREKGRQEGIVEGREDAASENEEAVEKARLEGEANARADLAVDLTSGGSEKPSLGLLKRAP